MGCQECPEFLGDFADGELDHLTALASLPRHLEKPDMMRCFESLGFNISEAGTVALRAVFWAVLAGWGVGVCMGVLSGQERAFLCLCCFLHCLLLHFLLWA